MNSEPPLCGVPLEIKNATRGKELVEYTSEPEESLPEAVRTKIVAIRRQAARSTDGEPLRCVVMHVKTLMAKASQGRARHCVQLVSISDSRRLSLSLSYKAASVVPQTAITASKPAMAPPPQKTVIQRQPSEPSAALSVSLGRHISAASLASGKVQMLQRGTTASLPASRNLVSRKQMMAGADEERHSAGRGTKRCAAAAVDDFIDFDTLPLSPAATASVPPSKAAQSPAAASPARGLGAAFREKLPSFSRSSVGPEMERARAAAAAGTKGKHSDAAAAAPRGSGEQRSGGRAAASQVPVATPQPLAVAARVVENHQAPSLCSARKASSQTLVATPVTRICDGAEATGRDQRAEDDMDVLLIRQTDPFLRSGPAGEVVRHLVREIASDGQSPAACSSRGASFLDLKYISSLRALADLQAPPRALSAAERRLEAERVVKLIKHSLRAVRGADALSEAELRGCSEKLDQLVESETSGGKLWLMAALLKGHAEAVADAATEEEPALDPHERLRSAICAVFRLLQ